MQNEITILKNNEVYMTMNESIMVTLIYSVPCIVDLVLCFSIHLLVEYPFITTSA